MWTTAFTTSAAQLSAVQIQIVEDIIRVKMLNTLKTGYENYLLHHGLLNFQKLLNLQEKAVIDNEDFRLFRISQILEILHSLGMPLKLIEHIFADFLRLRVS